MPIVAVGVVSIRGKEREWGGSSVAQVDGKNRKKAIGGSRNKELEGEDRSKRKCTLVCVVLASNFALSPSLNLTLTLTLSRPNLSAFLCPFCMSKTLFHLASFQLIQVWWQPKQS